jgi:hypothetical protein
MRRWSGSLRALKVAAHFCTEARSSRASSRKWRSLLPVSFVTASMTGRVFASLRQAKKIRCP